jgi:hypothetical protein
MEGAWQVDARVVLSLKASFPAPFQEKEKPNSTGLDTGLVEPVTRKRMSELRVGSQTYNCLALSIGC